MTKNIAGLIILCLGLICQVRADDIIWTGAAGSYWDQEGSWQGGEVPGCSDRAIFNSTSPNCIMREEIRVGGLWIQSSFSETVFQDGGTCYSSENPLSNVDVLIGYLGYLQEAGTMQLGKGEFIVAGVFQVEGGVFDGCEASITEGEKLIAMSWELFCDPSMSFSLLKKKLDASFYTMKDDKLLFFFNDIHDAQESLNVKVYDYKHKEINAGIEYLGNREYRLTVSGISVSITNPKNYYTMEVYDSNGERFQLRFKYTND